jgi:hypothetical protein
LSGGQLDQLLFSLQSYLIDKHHINPLQKASKQAKTHHGTEEPKTTSSARQASNPILAFARKSSKVN